MRCLLAKSRNPDGSRVGVYDVLEWVNLYKNEGVRILCTVCGREFVFCPSAMRNFDECFCKEYRGSKNKTKTQIALAKLGTKLSYLRKMIRDRLKKLGVGEGESRFLEPETILEAIGPRPKVEGRESVMMIRSGMLPEPQNFYWETRLSTELVNKAIESVGRKCNRAWIAKRINHDGMVLGNGRAASCRPAGLHERVDCAFESRCGATVRSWALTRRVPPHVGHVYHHA